MNSHNPTASKLVQALPLSRKERRMAGLETNTPLWFDAVIRPHRSLAPHNYRLILILVAVFSALAVLRFLTLNAWPVAIFFVLDAGMLWGALKLSYVTARAFETIQLTDNMLVVTRVSWRGHVQNWAFQPAWVAVALLEDEKPAKSVRVKLSERDRRVFVGEALSPMERRSLAQALMAALERKKAGRPPLM
ncbi:hypothetical protein GCM10007972_06830 [Iodidimonas muriae]|uniref:DUF2244 domain-containing protein n=1 Tax=Iodidimonas muriae TaxID=261467 RepID=A0ABQ2L972_9PROT|nr:DUF2244 domain-containing protein [Iodidimonas muriae]GGO07446.1 hypothetical protein GCM10007972_06830 [Iodidimonas muriae]